jgi:hypothetical protein
MAVRLVVGETYGHFVEHGEEIESALPRTVADVLARIDDVWRPFRAAIRERGRAGLLQNTPSGWTYRDLVAHAVGWTAQATRELETREFWTGWTKDTIQEFNDRSVRTHQLVGPEAMIDELDTTHRKFVDSVRRLTDANIADDRIFPALAYYTYLHWEEHFAELGIPL